MKTKSEAKAVGLFVVAILAAVVAWLTKDARCEEDRMIFVGCLGLMAVLGVCLLLVRGGVLGGLITLVCVGGLAMGGLENRKMERLKQESADVDKEVRRLKSLVP